MALSRDLSRDLSRPLTPTATAAAAPRRPIPSRAPSAWPAFGGRPPLRSDRRPARRDPAEPVKPLCVALVDCNSFYASCERALDPSLRDKPVAVLSNNDGCIIARTEEVKDLGIPMGAPLFKVRHLIDRHGVVLKSANFNLYGEFSARVMRILRDEAPACEVYSVDEAFLDLTGMGTYVSIEAWCQRLRQRLLRELDLPVSVGVGPTKVIAKLANRLAKRQRGTYVSVLLDPQLQEQVMRQTPVEDLWGIGRRNALRLSSLGITTAWQLRQCNTELLLRERSIVEVRLVHELRGQPCISLVESHPDKQQMATTRSFGQPVTELAELESAIAYFVRGSVRKLRKQRSAAGQIYVFARTSPFAPQQPLEHIQRLVTLPVPSSHPPELLRAAIDALHAIYRPGLRYKKAGVVLLDIRPDDSRQAELFRAVRPFDRIDQLNGLLTDLNTRYHREVMYWGSFHRNTFGWRPNSAYATTDAAIPDHLRVTDAERDLIRPWW